jgi:hypothetical protein
MGIDIVSDCGGEPNSWKVRHFANISGSEEFVAQLVMEMPELVDASMIFGRERERLKEAILAISIDGLMPAFEDLKKIRASVGQAIPELNRRELYKTFTAALWRSFKELMQAAAKLMEPDIGFLFQDDAKFEKGLSTWAGKRPVVAEEFSLYLRTQRTTWQNELKAFRDSIEHQTGDVRAGSYEHRYSPAHAEELFDAVWRTIADILALFISLRLPPGRSLVELPPEQRNANRPRRFVFAIHGISAEGAVPQL